MLSLSFGLLDLVAELSSKICKTCDGKEADEDGPLDLSTRVLRDITDRDNRQKKPQAASMESDSRGSTEGGSRDASRERAPTRGASLVKIPRVMLERMSEDFIAQRTHSAVESSEEKPFVSKRESGANDEMPSYFANETAAEGKVPLRRSVRVKVMPKRYTAYSIVDLTVVKPKKRRSNARNNENEVPRKKIKGAGDTAIPHEQHVLRLLNTGTVKNLQSLHTIGQKTAQQIVLYRELRGGFNNLRDLKNCLNKGRGYERFLQANFLA